MCDSFIGGGVAPEMPVSPTCSDPGVNGPTVEYCWWGNWNEDLRDFLDLPGNEDICHTDPNPFFIFIESGGSQQVRLRIEDTTGARAEVIRTFTGA